MQPGVVGSVGDTNLMIRLKHSAPDLPLRWSANTAFSRLPNYGSNVQNGSIPSYFSSSGTARLLDTKWNGLFYLIPGNRHMKTATGWKFQDLRANDLYREPIVTSQGDYTWHNQVGDVYRARHAGERFLPLPNGYGLQTGQIPRYINYILITKGWKSTNSVFCCPSTIRNAILSFKLSATIRLFEGYYSGCEHRGS